MEELQKVFEVMHVANVDHVELAAYQLKGVARVWYDQWKKSRADGALIVSWAVFDEAFLRMVADRTSRISLFLSGLSLVRISKRVYKVAYELEMPSELAVIHLVFHVSMLKKFLSDPSLIVPIENIGIKDNLSYEKVPVQILDRQINKLRTKEVASAKFLWSNQYVEEATWEAEEDMKRRHPHLFRSEEISNHGTYSL
ncbi:uncharacterized protein [Solanum tuberosum]|uniref:uncharacterized protein n=1 Tax=Solanum tuberosum TaxID=4113 RepID=UPI00073A0D02|nr:PREDICTED: uncharacterized protein LOC107062114 [Solanum tuberosum]